LGTALCVRGAEAPAGLVAGLAALRFLSAGDGLFLVELSTPPFRCVVADPLMLEVVTKDGQASWIRGAYADCRVKSRSAQCIGSIRTAAGTEFRFMDVYTPVAEVESFRLDRLVEVLSPSAVDAGFATRYDIGWPDGSEFGRLDFFAPGVWYRSNSNTPAYALASHMGDDWFFFREERLSAPMVMCRRKGDGAVLSILHADPDGSTFDGDDFLPRVTNERMQFGSLGVQRVPCGTLGFWYPGSEGQRTYIWGGDYPAARTAPRSHPVKAGVRHSYTLILRLGRSDSYCDAVRDAWRLAYRILDPPLIKADIPRVKRASLDLLARYAGDCNGAAGIPGALGLDGTVLVRGFLIGFVGAQTEAAWHLLRDGLERKDDAQVRKGKAIIDFWVMRNRGDITHTSYDADRRTWCDEPFRGLVFLRTLSDGYLGVVRAAAAMGRAGQPQPHWIEWCSRFGDWLVRSQNADGSFYRKYQLDGTPFWPSSVNTSHPIPFLVELWRATGKAEYTNAAVRAGSYMASRILEADEYVGGTPDNASVPDKEACLYALRAALSLHDATGDPLWVAIAERAATFADTWNYLWNVPMPPDGPPPLWPKGRSTVGISLIAMGNSGADFYNSGFAGEYLRLYRLTGDTHYRRVALLLLHNTKQAVDLGSLGHGFPGLQFEYMTMGLKRGTGLRHWLPWVSVVHLDGIVGIEDVCAVSDVEGLKPLPVAASSPTTVRVRMTPAAGKAQVHYLDCNGWAKFLIDPQNTGVASNWMSPSHDDRDWPFLTIPLQWEAQRVNMSPLGIPRPDWDPYNGYAWYRIRVFVPNTWRSVPRLRLILGAVDDADETYFNGVKIGQTGTFPLPGSLDYKVAFAAKRSYPVPHKLVRFGEENVIAVKVYDGGGLGGITQPVFLTGRAGKDRVD
jgi:hypothetical protein